MPNPLDIEINEKIPSSSGAVYRILQQLGSGGNSVVYLVLALNGPFRGVLFALKIFTRITEADRLAKFQQEFTFLKDTNHPAIMRIYDDGIYTFRGVDGIEQDFPFVVAEYLPDTLFDLLRGRMVTAEKLTIILQMLAALNYLHSLPQAVTHRDIKPKNIFVKGRSCVLGDFGLMKISQDAEADREIFKESIGPGMPFAYRTPDLVAYAKQKSDLTPKSDVFQLGLVTCQVFTGINPCKTAKDHLDPIDLSPIPAIRGIHGARVRELIQQMLTADPKARPAAADLIDPWEGVFREVVSVCHQLNGRVF
jgi:serine/threonine protein kinase